MAGPPGGPHGRQEVRLKKKKKKSSSLRPRPFRLVVHPWAKLALASLAPPLQECQMLLDGGMQPNTNCGSRAIGYRQGLEFLQRCHADPGSITEQAVVSAAVGRQQAPPAAACLPPWPSAARQRHVFD